MSVSVLVLYKILDFAAKESQPWIAVHRTQAVVKLAGVDGVDDLVLLEPEFPAGGLRARDLNAPSR
ncbi:MAG: hypothetical protein ACREQM_23445 [Candidatus Dormibacteraceae bacterium]